MATLRTWVVAVDRPEGEAGEVVFGGEGEHRLEIARADGLVGLVGAEILPRSRQLDGPRLRVQTPSASATTSATRPAVPTAHGR